MELTKELKDLLYQQGADLVDIGDMCRKCFAVCGYTQKYLKGEGLCLNQNDSFSEK